MTPVRSRTLFETWLTTRGRGVESDPVRVIYQLWDGDGTLVAEIDPFLQDAVGRPIHRDTPTVTSAV